MKALVVTILAVVSFSLSCHAGLATDDKTLAVLQKFTKLDFGASVNLANDIFPTFHPQGVKGIGRDVYVSTVEQRGLGAGHVIKFQLNSASNPSSATPVSRVTFDSGPQKN